MKDDKRKLFDDAVAELKNAAGDGKVTSEKGQEEGDGRRQGQARAKKPVKKAAKSPGRKRRALDHPKKPKSLMIWPLTSVAPFWASKSSKRSKIR